MDDGYDEDDYAEEQPMSAKDQGMDMFATYARTKAVNKSC